jgi:predicted GTPase
VGARYGLGGGGVRAEVGQGERVSWGRVQDGAGLKVQVGCAETYAKYPAIGVVLPAMGYGEAELAELGGTIRAADAHAVVIGTPMDLARLVDFGHPARQASYELREIGTPTLATVLAPYLEKWRPPLTGRPPSHSKVSRVTKS